MIPGVAAHLWQSTVFAGAAWLVALALRENRAQVRYWVWFTASAKFLIPFSWLVGLGRLCPIPWLLHICARNGWPRSNRFHVSRSGGRSARARGSRRTTITLQGGRELCGPADSRQWRFAGCFGGGAFRSCGTRRAR